MSRFDQIHDLVQHWAGQTPDAPALCEDGRVLGYAALWQAIGQLADGLRALGLQPGQRLMVVGENCVAQVILLLAASRCDLWVILANARLTVPELAEMQQHSGAACRLFASAASEAARRHAEEAGATAWPAWPGLAVAPGASPGADSTPERVPADPGERILALVYTSGTTGAPKGVMLRQRSLLFVATRSAEVRGLRPDDRVCGVLPFSHVYGLSSVLLATLAAGACLQVLPRFSADAVQRALQEDGITILQGVPTLYLRLLEAGQGRAPRLRGVFTGGAPLDVRLKAAVEAAFGLPLHNGYGLTEHSPSVCQTRLDAPVADDAVGPPLPGVALRVVNGAGNPLPAGACGEVQVRSPAVMAGYFRAPGLTHAAFTPEGWLRTGDLGRQASDGTLHLLGRSKELIIRSGFKVFPQEVEGILQRQPGVRLAAVVGIDHPGALHGGDQEVAAFVEWAAAHPFDPAALQAALGAVLAPYKIPTRWIQVRQWPLSLAGKIRKAELPGTML